MLHITVTAKKRVPPESDGLGRRFVGYEEGMTQDQMYEANHGEWAIGAKARDREKYALFTFGRTVIQAVEIESMRPTKIFEDVPGEHRDDRYTLDGKILKKGHPVYDKYVGKETPLSPARNPVRYFNDPEFDGGRSCRCGCGEPTTGGDFVPGHDQRAIHQRIARIGTVAEFLDWMDSVRPASVPK